MKPPPVDVELAPLALDDIEQAAHFIARANATAAREFLESIGHLLELLSQGPEIGPRVVRLEDRDIRAITVPGFRSYRAFYVCGGMRKRLRVVRVLHGARDWPPLLDE